MSSTNPTAQPRTLADAVKQLRLEKAWTQEHLAAASGLSVRTVQRIERGEAASLETLKAMAAALDVSLDRLRADQETSTMSTPLDHAAPVPAPGHDPRVGFLRHLAVYAIVMAGLFAFNLLTPHDRLWALYPLLGWGIGVAVHGFRSYGRASGR